MIGHVIRSLPYCAGGTTRITAPPPAVMPRIER
jgi:hypothetical protein